MPDISIVIKTAAQLAGAKEARAQIERIIAKSQAGNIVATNAITVPT